jgi:hypothetical protein
VDPSFTLNGQTLLSIGAIIGTLAGTITFLFRKLIEAKDSRIAALEREMLAQREVMLAEINALRADRNYFRDLIVAERRERRERRGSEPA